MRNRLGHGTPIVFAIIVLALVTSITWFYWGTRSHQEASSSLARQAVSESLTSGGATTSDIRGRKDAGHEVPETQRLPAEAVHPPAAPVKDAESDASVASAARKWLERLDNARESFEFALNQKTSNPAASAYSLLGVVIMSDLDRQGRFAIIPPGEKVSLDGPRVPEGEMRIGFGNKLYTFQVSEYPAYGAVRAALSEPSHQEGSSGESSGELTSDLMASINELYMSVRQRLEQLPGVK